MGGSRYTSVWGGSRHQQTPGQRLPVLLVLRIPTSSPRKCTRQLPMNCCLARVFGEGACFVCTRTCVVVLRGSGYRGITLPPCSMAAPE